MTATMDHRALGLHSRTRGSRETHEQEHCERGVSVGGVCGEDQGRVCRNRKVRGRYQ